MRGCKDQENQAQYKGQMDSAVRDFLQESKAGCVVMKTRQHDQQPLDNDRGRRCGGSKAHFRVELLFKLLQSFFVGGTQSPMGVQGG